MEVMDVFFVSILTARQFVLAERHFAGGNDRLVSILTSEGLIEIYCFSFLWGGDAPCGDVRSVAHNNNEFLYFDIKSKQLFQS